MGSATTVAELSSSTFFLIKDAALLDLGSGAWTLKSHDLTWAYGDSMSISSIENSVSFTTTGDQSYLADDDMTFTAGSVTFKTSASSSPIFIETQDPSSEFLIGANAVTYTSTSKIDINTPKGYRSTA